MSFLDNIFKTAPATPAAPAPQPAPAADPTATNTMPNDPATNQAPAPKDEFESLWQTDNNSTSQGLNFNLDPEQLSQIAGKIDYSQAITPEIRQRLALGGEEAVAATLEALNLVSRQNYQQNAIATTKLIEAAVKSTEASMDTRIQKQIRLMGLSDGVTASNPALSNPAFSPIVEAAKQQIVAKFPNATQQELNKMLGQYLSKAGEAFNPDLVKKANTPVGPLGANSADQDVDWLAFLQ